MFKPNSLFALLSFGVFWLLGMPCGLAEIPRDVVWEATLEDFSDESYHRAVEAAFQTWEAQVGQAIKPAHKGRVGLKVYTRSGLGLATPRALVRAVIAALERRGYERAQMFVFDLTQKGLREAGFLPPLSARRSDFEGVPVYAIREGNFYDPVWFYDNPLPSHNPTTLELGLMDEEALNPEDRKSFIPIPLIAQADFWINLPMVVDSQSIGVSGALANATLWNASNTRRFLRSPANAPVAVAEMAAVPELWESWAFTLLTLERYQFVGGLAFNSLYTRSEPLLWMSANPVALDYLMYQRMNRHRVFEGLPPIAPRPLIFDYSEAIGLGSWKPDALIYKPIPLK